MSLGTTKLRADKKRTRTGLKRGDPRPLTDRERAFVDCYTETRNLKTAAVAGEYNEGYARRILSENKGVKDAVASFQKVVEEKAAISRQDVIDKLWEVVAEGFKKHDIQINAFVKKLAVPHDLKAATAALKLLGIEIGMFKTNALTDAANKIMPLAFYFGPTQINQIVDDGNGNGKVMKNLTAIRDIPALEGPNLKPPAGN